MPQLTPSLTLAQAITAALRSFSPILRVAIAVALLLALLTISILIQHAIGIHTAGPMPAAAHHALADGPNLWGCGSAPGPC